MTTVQIFAVATPVVAALFMGAVALVERRYDRAPGEGVVESDKELVLAAKRLIQANLNEPADQATKRPAE